MVARYEERARWRSRSGWRGSAAVPKLSPPNKMPPVRRQAHSPQVEQGVALGQALGQGEWEEHRHKKAHLPPPVP